MTHPGLPWGWALAVWLFMLALTLHALRAPGVTAARHWRYPLSRLPLAGVAIRYLLARPWPLEALKIISVALFLLVIVAGLAGTPIPERNLATALTWNLWWTGLIVSVFFLGSSWCAVCPWDTLADWLVKRRLWRRAPRERSLNLRVPAKLRNLFPALLLFIALSWLELGVGVTASPYATASIALLMLVLASVSLALFERKAFCRYFCPVGRTVGFYAQLAPVELRPLDAAVCGACTTLECYHGNAEVEPCPTHLVMGRITQNTYCTSCGHCVRSCPHKNVTWRLRPTAAEASQDARPHGDEAWFMLTLLALTLFHGLTMLPLWERWMRALADLIGDSGRLLWSFSLGLTLALALPLLAYALAVWLTQRVTRTELPFARLFTRLAFVALPLAFAYHLAHNLGHLIRENDNLVALLANPLGQGALPLSLAEKHARHLHLLLPEGLLSALQAGLMMLGFYLAVCVIRRRGGGLPGGHARGPGLRLLPMLAFALAVQAGGLWLLTQPMNVRM